MQFTKTKLLSSSLFRSTPIRLQQSGGGVRRSLTNHVLMVRPHTFRMNEETSVNNYYQQIIQDTGKSGEDINTVIKRNAQTEFDNHVENLRRHGVKVTVVQDTGANDTPDSCFPNNWISFHGEDTRTTDGNKNCTNQSGKRCLWPMFAENRRRERKLDVMTPLAKDGYVCRSVVDYSHYETNVNPLYMEGTGAMVLDRGERKAYCALSDRASEEILQQFCKDFKYEPVPFVANQTLFAGTPGATRAPIYHTNVMMAAGDSYSVVCLSSIDDTKQRLHLADTLRENKNSSNGGTGRGLKEKKEIIEISEEQVGKFAGNMLQVLGRDRPYLVMSTSAYNSLEESQKKAIRRHNEIIHSDIPTLETCGGGSVRCLMAEVF